MKMIYCPAYKGIYENEMADSFAKVAAKAYWSIIKNTGK